MLKWIVPPKSGREASANPPAPRPNSTGSVSSTSATSRVTDDPLAAIGIHQPKSSLYSKLSLPFTYGRREEEEIYSVTRVNPLFRDGVEMADADLGRQTSEDADYMFLSDESDVSVGPRHSPSSSGYESWAPAKAAGVDRRHMKTSTAWSTGRQSALMASEDDYRRQFVVGGSLVKPKRTAAPPAAPPVTLPRIGKANVLQQNGNFVSKVQMGADQSVKTDHVTPAQTKIRDSVKTPAPVWPNGAPAGVHRQSRAVIEQNENYVTQILINPQQQQQQLAKWDTDGAGESNYDSIITDSLLMWMSYDQEPDSKHADNSQGGVISAPSKNDEHAVRELSQTMSRSQTIATVSRAFNSSGLVDERRSSGPSSLSRGFWLVRDFWEKNSAANGRHLLVESDEDEADPQRRTSSGSPAKYWTHNETLKSRFDPDRLSNSSSRSSGSRRVTFSADTVDNEPSQKSSSSSMAELHLNPVYLARYQPTVVSQVKVATSRAEVRAPIKATSKVPPTGPARYGQNFYTSNLQMYSDRHADQSAKSGSTPANEQQKMWETYYGAFNKMEPHGNLQLHPNHPAVYSDNTVCLDFTLDSGNVSLIQRRSVNQKLRRRLCCCVLLLLAVGVVIVVVVGISLYLTHGQKYFGSI